MWQRDRRISRHTYLKQVIIFDYILLTVPASASNQFTWHPSGELHMSVGGGNSVAIDGRAKDAPNQEDVEVMSTDSSSSSSSDSQ